MPLTTAEILSSHTNAGRSVPIGVTSNWRRCVLAKGQGSAVSDGGPEVADAAAIVNPTTEIVLTTRVLIDCRGLASQLLAFRLGYNSGAGTLTSPVVAAFGRTETGNGSYDGWELLPNLAGDVSMTLTAASTTDIVTGSYKHTRHDPILNVISREGCDFILMGVLTAFNAGTGTEDDSYIEVKEV